jgi:Zn-dependent peptidase ImmA (M78 family)
MPVREQIPVTPSVVRWARERAGYSLQELAEYFSHIPEWEEGKAGPTYPQLESLADKLKVPIAVFFFPAPPATPPIEETFRTLPTRVFSTLPVRVRMLMRKAKAFQINVAELCNGRNPAERLITQELSFTVRSPIIEMAATVRQFLGITLEEQADWQNDDTALRHWREALEKAGIFILKDSFQAPEFSGFCLTDLEFPLIYVNNNCAKTRQAFTLFHELAHLLFSTSGIDSLSELQARPGQAQRIEVICNRFAAEFLMPSQAFEGARRGMPATEASAEALANRFKVSREAVYRRFLDGGSITQVVYDEAARRWAAGSEGGNGGNYYNTKLAYLGRQYVGLALGAYHQNRITEDQLADYLDVKPRNIAVLEETFMQGSAA